MINPSFCRLCLQPDSWNTPVPIFKDNIQFYEKINKLLGTVGVKVTKNDKLPDCVCHRCLGKIDFIEDFIKMVKEKNMFLKNLMCPGDEEEDMDTNEGQLTDSEQAQAISWTKGKSMHVTKERPSASRSQDKKLPAVDLSVCKDMDTNEGQLTDSDQAQAISWTKKKSVHVQKERPSASGSQDKKLPAVDQRVGSRELKALLDTSAVVEANSARDHSPTPELAKKKKVKCPICCKIVGVRGFISHMKSHSRETKNELAKQKQVPHPVEDKSRGIASGKPRPASVPDPPPRTKPNIRLSNSGKKQLNPVQRNPFNVIKQEVEDKGKNLTSNYQLEKELVVCVNRVEVPVKTKQCLKCKGEFRAEVFVNHLKGCRFNSAPNRTVARKKTTPVNFKIGTPRVNKTTRISPKKIPETEDDSDGNLNDFYKKQKELLDGGDDRNDSDSDYDFEAAAASDSSVDSGARSELSSKNVTELEIKNKSPEPHMVTPKPKGKSNYRDVSDNNSEDVDGDLSEVDDGGARDNSSDSSDLEELLESQCNMKDVGKDSKTKQSRPTVARSDSSDMDVGALMASQKDLLGIDCENSPEEGSEPLGKVKKASPKEEVAVKKKRRPVRRRAQQYEPTSDSDDDFTGFQERPRKKPSRSPKKTSEVKQTIQSADVVETSVSAVVEETVEVTGVSNNEADAVVEVNDLSKDEDETTIIAVVPGKKSNVTVINLDKGSDSDSYAGEGAVSDLMKMQEELLGCDRDESEGNEGSGGNLMISGIRSLNQENTGPMQGMLLKKGTYRKRKKQSDSEDELMLVASVNSTPAVDPGTEEKRKTLRVRKQPLQPRYVFTSEEEEFEMENKRPRQDRRQRTTVEEPIIQSVYVPEGGEVNKTAEPSIQTQPSHHFEDPLAADPLGNPNPINNENKTYASPVEATGQSSVSVANKTEVTTEHHANVPNYLVGSVQPMEQSNSSFQPLIYTSPVEATGQSSVSVANKTEVTTEHHANVPNYLVGSVQPMEQSNSSFQPLISNYFQPGHQAPSVIQPIPQIQSAVPLPPLISIDTQCRQQTMLPLTHTCNICYLTFLSEGSLNIHKQIHYPAA